MVVTDLDHYPARPARTGVKVTTLKVRALIGGGLRIYAALDGMSAAEAAELSVIAILKQHGRTGTTLEKVKVGRPPSSMQEAASAVLNLRPPRKDTIPTRLHIATAGELANLARDLSVELGELAADGAEILLRRGSADLPRDLAGLTTPEAQSAAWGQVAQAAAGNPVVLHRSTTPVIVEV